MSQPKTRSTAFDRLSHVSLWAVAVLGIGYPLYTRLDPSTARTRAVGDLAMVAAALWAALACAVRAREPGPYRRVARRLTAYSLAWGLGQAAWAYYEVVAGREVPFPSLADVGYLGAMPFGIAAALAIPAARYQARGRALLDGLLVALSLLFVAWTLVLGDIIDEGGSLSDVVLGCAYPIGDTVIIALVVHALAQMRSTSLSPYLLLGGLLSIGIGDTLFAFLSVTDDYQTGNPIDLGWLLGFLLLAAGAWAANDLPAGATAPEEEVPSGPLGIGDYLRLLTPYLFVLPMMVTTTVLLVTGLGLDIVHMVVGFAAFVIMVGRQVLTSFESERRMRSLHFSAAHDDVTGIWNRPRFRAHVDQALRERRSVAVLFLDLDDFKDVNDAHGHSVGDRLLQSVAGRLRATVRPDDRCARLGGDEFVVAAGVATIGDAIGLAARVLASVSAPHRTDHGREVSVSGSIGIAMSPADGETAEVLLRNADLAMYAAKRSGKNRYEVFEPAMHAGVVARLELTRELELAARTGEFRLHYQPKYDLATHAIVGAEALLRWEHPSRGLLRPPEFIAVAEESGLLVDVGRWVLETACEFASWLDSEDLVGPEFEVCVNVASCQLQEPDFVSGVREVLDRWPGSASRIVLELTESSLIDAGTAQHVLDRLKELGLQLAIDDFGTGYSSLSYLQRFPVDILKVDRSFVAEVDRGVEQEAMAKAIIALARSLHLKTIAEGIEQEYQLAAMQRLGCDQGQGFLWSPALPEQEVVQLLAEEGGTSGRRAEASA